MNIIIADQDEQYLEHLARYFMEKAEQCEIYTFSSSESLMRFVHNQAHTDILLIDKSIICKELNQANISVKILLSTDNTNLDGYESVKKYQKTGNILQEILLLYAEKTGDINAIKGNRKTKIVAFYSPVGGSGKTTLALNTAAACVGAGLQTFYLNLEKIDSSSCILGSTTGTLSDIFLTLKSKGADVGVKILTCRGTEVHTGFHYISAPDSISEYGEVTSEEWEKLLSAFLDLEEYDVLIIDFSSEFYPDKIELLKKCDMIFVPVLLDEFSINKMQLLFHENVLHKEYSSIIKKMKLIVNKAEISGGNLALRNTEIFQKCPLVAEITMAPIFMNQKNLLRSAEIVKAMFEPIVACIGEGKHD